MLETRLIMMVPVVVKALTSRNGTTRRGMDEPGSSVFSTDSTRHDPTWDPMCGEEITKNGAHVTDHQCHDFVVVTLWGPDYITDSGKPRPCRSGFFTMGLEEISEYAVHEQKPENAVEHGHGTLKTRVERESRDGQQTFYRRPGLGHNG